MVKILNSEEVTFVILMKTKEMTKACPREAVTEQSSQPRLTCMTPHIRPLTMLELLLVSVCSESLNQLLQWLFMG